MNPNSPHNRQNEPVQNIKVLVCRCPRTTYLKFDIGNSFIYLSILCTESVHLLSPRSVHICGYLWAVARNFSWNWAVSCDGICSLLFNFFERLYLELSHMSDVVTRFYLWAVARKIDVSLVWFCATLHVLEGSRPVSGGRPKLCMVLFDLEN